MSKAIRLVAVDMDGTLLDSRKQLPPDFLPWVISHPEIVTVAASGRQYYRLVKMFPGADRMILMADNGALIYRATGELLNAVTMSEEQLHSALAVVRGIPGAVPILCGTRSAYSDPSTGSVFAEAGIYYERLQGLAHPEEMISVDPMVKVAVCFPDGTAEQHLADFDSLPQGLTPTLSGVCWIDVSRTDVNKGTGLRFLQEFLGISPEECMAFGDYLNDLPMLRCAGESYAMANAHPLLKQEAKHETASNDEGGVMQVLKRLWP